MKRKTIAALLIIAMIMGLFAPAYAVDTPTEAPEQTREQPQPQEPEQEETPVVVSTLEELKAAVAVAEDGDTVAVSTEITLDGVALETDKDIALVRVDTYESGALIRMKNGAKLSGFNLTETKYSKVIITESSAENSITIENCHFNGDTETAGKAFFLNKFRLPIYTTMPAKCASTHYFPGFQRCPHFRQVSTVFPLPMNPVTMLNPLAPA